jgi:hypothetical protein
MEQRISGHKHNPTSIGADYIYPKFYKKSKRAYSLSHPPLGGHRLNITYLLDFSFHIDNYQISFLTESFQ